MKSSKPILWYPSIGFVLFALVGLMLMFINLGARVSPFNFLFLGVAAGLFVYVVRSTIEKKVDGAEEVAEDAVEPVC